MKEYIGHITKKGLLLVARSSGIAVLSAALLVFMGIKINAVTATIVKTRIQHDGFTAKYEQFDKLKKDAETVAGIQKQLDSAIPTTDTMPSVVDYINALGARTNTTVAVQFNSTMHAGETSLGQLGFAMQASGSLKDVLDLFKKIENAPYLISIQTVGITLDKTTQQIAAEASGVVYIQTANP